LGGCKTNKIVAIKKGRRFKDLVDLLRKNVDIEGIAEWTEMDG